MPFWHKKRWKRIQRKIVIFFEVYFFIFPKIKKKNVFLLHRGKENTKDTRTRYPQHCSSSNSTSNQKLASRGRKERNVGIVWRRWRGGVQRKWLPRKRAARRNRTVFQDEWSLRKGEASAVQPSRMPVLVSGASFACNFVRGSYLEVRVTTSQPVTGQRPPRSPLLYSFLTSVDKVHSMVSAWITRTSVEDRATRKRRFFRVGGHPIFDRVKNDFISAEWLAEITWERLFANLVFAIWIMFRIWMEIGQEN